MDRETVIAGLYCVILLICIYRGEADPMSHPGGRRPETRETFARVTYQQEQARSSVAAVSSGSGLDMPSVPC